MNHDLPGTRRTALTAGVVMALGAGLITAGVLTGAADGGRGPTTAGGVRLVSYDSCDTALTEMKDQAIPHVGPFGFDFGGGDFGAGGGEVPLAVPDARASEGDSKMALPAEGQPPQTPGQDHSTTNVHEAGVDEPDAVKTDGRRVVSVTDGVVRVLDVATHTQTAAIHLDGGSATQLLIAGDRALVMTTRSIAYDVPGIAPGEKGPVPAPTDTVPYGSQLALLDLTGAGKVLGTLSIDGNYLDARQIGDVARVVVRSAPRLEFRYPTSDDTVASLVANKDVVADSTIQDWLPRYELTAGGATSGGQLTACDDVSHPVDYTATAMLTVLSFDLTKDLGTGDPVTIVADGDTVYGTEKSLYVADDHQMEGMARGPVGIAGGGPGAGQTELYQFDIARPGKPVHVASGAVEGNLLNQYSLSEYDGNLRVATTTAGEAGSQSRITVLSRKGNELTQVGMVGGLGAGERIYAVRFFGDTGYVVTFRQTDPLYTVDLRDPAAPKVTGELKITGYSAYLHPAGDGRLIGVGQEASDTGRTQGVQVSLFDTSNPAGATRIAQYHLESSWTEVEGDAHAFLYWPDKGLVVLPVTGGGAADPTNPNVPPEAYGGALVLKLTDNSFTQVGLLNHMSDRYGDYPIVPRRAMVIGNELWTVSEAGAMANDLDSLSQRAWVPFT
jgi:hypothetical protein